MSTAENAANEYPAQPAEPELAPGTPSALPPAGYSRSRVLKNFFSIAGIAILTRLIGFVIGIKARNVLGPAVIGAIEWNGALMGYVALLTNPGMFTIAKRDAARDPTQIPALLSRMLVIQIGASVVMAVVAIGLVATGARPGQAGQILLVQTVGSIVAAFALNWILESQERLILPSLLALATVVIQVPLVYLFIRGPADGVLYVSVPAACVVLGAAILLRQVRRLGLLHLRMLRPTVVGIGTLFRDSWPITVGAAAASVYYYCDALILGFTHGDQTVGLYSTAYQLMLFPTGVCIALLSAYSPSFARAGTDLAACRRVADEFLRILVLLGAPIAIGGFLVAREAVRLLLSPQYADSGAFLQWLSLDIAFIFIGWGITAPMQSMGMQHLFLRVTLLAGAFNLVANLIVIPIFGPWGAVATTIAAEILAMSAAVLYRRRWIGIDLRLVAVPIFWFVGMAVIAWGVAAAVGGSSREVALVRGGLFGVGVLIYWSVTLGPIRRRITARLPWRGRGSVE